MEARSATIRILCLGHAAIDAIYRVASIPPTPTKIFAMAFAESGGGMAANASVAAVRLGAKAHYWGRIGNDLFGDRIIAQLAAEGVDITTVRRVDGCVSPSAAIIVDERGERLICVYDDPALDDDPSWLPLASVAEFNAVLADVRWPAGAASVLEAARAARVPTVFDGDTGPVDALRDLAARADYSIFSEPGLAIASASAEPGEGLRRMARTTPV